MAGFNMTKRGETGRLSRLPRAWVARQASPVTVPSTTVPVPIAGKAASIGYGALPLNFTPVTTSEGSICTMHTGVGTQDVALEIPGASPIQIAQSDMSATVNFVPANTVGATIPTCNFAPLEAVINPSITPPLSDFAHTNNCLLTPTYDANWDYVARWTMPGIAQKALSPAVNSDVELYTTRPVTYYVDLDTLPGSPGSTGTFQATMQALAAYVEATLSQNLPAIDRIALFQAPPRHLLVTNPFGRTVGIGGNNTVRRFAGAGYAQVGGRSVAWILEPVLGDYHVSLTGRVGSKFRADVADLQFLGHGAAPLIENFAWNGVFGRAGTASKKFSVHGTALSPVLVPHESHTKVKPLTQVRFTLTDSVIPLGITKAVWRFGDGTKATGRPTVHRYRKVGRYTPTLTVTDAAGDTVTVKLKTIIVSG
jgi:hypothetical protein